MAVDLDRVGLVVVEPRGGQAVRGRQRRPQLHAVQLRAVLRRVLRVVDPPPCGHQVELSGTDHHPRPERVAMLDLTGEQPGDGLQRRVRVRGHAHPAVLGRILRAEVVQEAPRADQRPVSVRQRPPDPQSAGGGQHRVTRTDDLDRCGLHCHGHSLGCAIDGDPVAPLPMNRSHRRSGATGDGDRAVPVAYAPPAGARGAAPASGAAPTLPGSAGPGCGLSRGCRGATSAARGAARR
ncbi:hypothetical protein SDC9_140462 [bioreactor metagenome]|uniref:Uncharacterized protein n=1 Tax=bioreactor metagenome TaxID=1076179 RepID=A0A645DVK4_9ZZZZ